MKLTYETAKPYDVAEIEFYPYENETVNKVTNILEDWGWNVDTPSKNYRVVYLQDKEQFKFFKTEFEKAKEMAK